MYALQMNDCHVAWYEFKITITSQITRLQNLLIEQLSPRMKNKRNARRSELQYEDVVRAIRIILRRTATGIDINSKEVV
jgi:hypothetical protein